MHYVTDVKDQTALSVFIITKQVSICFNHTKLFHLFLYILITAQVTSSYLHFSPASAASLWPPSQTSFQLLLHSCALDPFLRVWAPLPSPICQRVLVTTWLDANAAVNFRCKPSENKFCRTLYTCLFSS